MSEIRHSRQPLTDQQLHQWETDGYLLLPRIIPQSYIDGVRDVFIRTTDQMIAQLKDEGLIDDERKDLPLETRFTKVAGEHANHFGGSWRKAVAQPEVFELHRVNQLVGVIAQLAGTDVIGHPIFNARPKLPHQQRTVVPWHQDSGYFGADTIQSLIITCWVPVVPVDADNGGMQILPGSHRLGLLDHHHEAREGNFLEIAEAENMIDESRAVTCVMEPGDVLLFHNLTFHRSLPNVSKTIRWSIDIRYMRDGDHPGRLSWTDPDDKWVIRSQTQPVTTLEQWLDMTERLWW